MTPWIRRLLYRHGWDTRCRNLVPVRLLRPILAALPQGSGPVVLDVGSGGFGVAAFLPRLNVVGTDLEPPAETAPNLSFRAASAAALPFEDGEFPVVTCIDMLEHVPPAVRAEAIQECVRTASHAALFACPHHLTAPACDRAFREGCERRGHAVPQWLAEHERQPYPVIETLVEDIRRAAARTGRGVKISISYCEPVAVCRLVRAAAARSSVLYAAVNLLFGMCSWMFPASEAARSYRVVVLAEMSPAGRPDPDSLESGTPATAQPQPAGRHG